MNAATIAVSAILLCLSTGLGVAMHRGKGNPDSVFAKALLRGIRVLPVRSFAYAFFAAVIVFFGLLVADRASGYLALVREDFTGIFMNYEKLSTKFAYPLMAIKGREEISQGHPKILVVGDSFVWGDGSTNLNQIWWNVMARELERRGYDCQVYAAGLCRASTYDEFLWLKDTPLLEDIEPDLVIIGYVTNDTDMNSIIPAVESVHEVYISGSAAQYFYGQLTLSHGNPCWLLVGITAVF